MKDHSSEDPKELKRRRARKSLAEEMPREAHIKSHLSLLMKQYIPLLEGEAPERVSSFLYWRTYFIPEVLRLQLGEHWMNQQDAMSFLRFMRGCDCPFPPHLLNCSSLAAAEHSADNCRKGALLHLHKNIGAGNAGFFRALASLMERAPEKVEEDYPAYVRKIAQHLIRHRFLYKTGDRAPRGKNYLQKLVLAVTDVFIGAEHRLPRVSELRAGLAILMEKPPGKREVLAALRSIGLAGVDPPVLDP